MHLQAYLLLSLGINAALSYNEEPCRSTELGFCMSTSSSSCPGNQFVSGKCPTQPSGIRCCKSAPYQESQCQAIGGTCRDDQLCGGGTTHSGKCPTQPAGIKCCVPAATSAYNEEPCRSTELGFCMSIQSGGCPGSQFVTGKCPSQAVDIRCCLSVPYQEPECQAIGGTCRDDQLCAGGTVQSGKCPTQPAGIKCCVPASSGGGSCGSAVQSLACQILSLRNNNQLFLKPNHFSSLGNNPYDGAAVLDNIKDTCNGGKAKRSSYGNAPGGSTCLGRQMLQALYDYAVQFYGQYGQALQVNSLAGGSHSRTSRHYGGNVMDIACTTPRNHCKAMENFCRARGAIELCYPGSSCGGHGTWVHCAF